MVKKAGGIVVTGDVALDWLQWTVEGDLRPPEGQTLPNWQFFPRTRLAAREGGALLLARMVEAATGLEVGKPSLGKRPEEFSPPSSGELLHSLVRLGLCPAGGAGENQEKQKNRVFRVQELLGYMGPPEGQVPALALSPEDDPLDAALVVLDDAGNGFRDQKAAWPRAIETKQPLVILKRSRPLREGQLWETMLNYPSEKLVVVLSADELRTEGVNISRRLSWERTAMDFLWHLQTNKNLGCLRGLGHLVVRFGVDGALYYRQTGKGPEAQLIYDPGRVEGDFNEEVCPGHMVGIVGSLVAALVRNLVEHDLSLAALPEGIREGIYAARRLLQKGFGPDQKVPGFPALPLEEIFGPRKTPEQEKGKHRDEEPLIAKVDLPRHCTQGAQGDPDPYFWEILHDLAGSRLEEVARDIVLLGVEATAIQGGADSEPLHFPAARFKNLVTLDRVEMESLRSVKNVMQEYLKKPQPQPLSLAVFGPPGSGKSFAVKQVAKTIAVEGVKIHPMEFNLSQWESPRDLVRAFHQVRDVVLGGEVPLVFFDEFDADFQGPLGWLKYFLDPMQQGKFKEGEIIHHLGKTILVFAGGTSQSLEEFSREAPAEVPGFPKEKSSEEKSGEKGFRQAKGPDFVSRLKGYVNILGVNCSGPTDTLYLIRRAVVLRTLLENLAQKFPQLFGPGRKLEVHPNIVTSFLMVPRYKHGVRSMEAILNMSQLADRPVFEQAALPPEVQLELHVDAAIFLRLPGLKEIFKQKRDDLAELIHEKFREEQEGKKPADDPAMQPWETLREDLKESNRQQADQIPARVAALNCVFWPAPGPKASEVKFTQKEVEFLARQEHHRWLKEKLAAGWIYGPGDRDDKLKTHPALLIWRELVKHDKDKNYKTVKGIPQLLAKVGLEIRRLEK